MDVLSYNLLEIESRLAFYPTEVMVYFEKHHIFQIVFDLMMLLNKNRPQCIEQFVADNIESIAKKYTCTNTFINVSDNIGIDRIRHTFKHRPIIAVQDVSNLDKALRKLNENLMYLNLDCKDKIFLGDNRMLGEIEKHFQINTKMDASVSNLEVVHKKIEERSNFLKIICPHAVVPHFQRIVILGRPGCGKHRIGRWLSERLGVSLVSMTDLLAEHTRSQDTFGMALRIGSHHNSHSSELLATIIQRRLLQPDCLAKGWILVDFPNTAHDVTSFFKMLITPNIVLFMNTDESVCCRRKQLLRKFKPACWKNMILQAEMSFYNFHQSIRDALAQQMRCAVLEIDGNLSYSHIQKIILEKLMIRKNTLK